MFSFASPSINLLGFELHVHIAKGKGAANEPAELSAPIAPMIESLPVSSTAPPKRYIAPADRVTFQDFHREWYVQNPTSTDSYLYWKARKEFGRKNGLINSAGYGRIDASSKVLVSFICSIFLILGFAFNAIGFFYFASLIALPFGTWWYLNERTFKREFGY